MLACAPRDAIDEAVRRDAVTTELAGVACLALAPPDALLASVVHATRWEPVPPLRWAADAALVVRSEGARFDWLRLVERSRDAHAEPALRAALDYLEERLEIAVPAGVRRRLGRGARWRRLELDASLRPAPERSPLGALAVSVGVELRRAARPGERLGDLAALRVLVGRCLARAPADSPLLPWEGLRLGVGADDAPFLGSGWSWAEPDGRWTDGREATLRFRLDSALRPPSRLELDLVPFLAPGTARRSLRLLWDREQIAESRWEGDELHRRRLVVDLPARALGAGGHELRIVVADAVMPHAVGYNFDARELGFFVERLRLTGATPAGSASLTRR